MSVAVTDVQASADPTEISVGGITQVVASVLPANATDKKITYKSSDEKVATVNPETGVVTGAGEGTAIITASSTNGKEDTVEITVKNVKVTEIQISANSAEVGVDGFIDLTTTILPTNASTQLLDWTSSDVNIATVDVNGRVKGIAVGKAVITAAATDGSNVTAQYEINVMASDDMEIELTNPYEENGQKVDVSGNTVLWGKPMNIRVQMRKNGQPMQKANIVMKWERLASERDGVNTSSGVNFEQPQYELKEDYESTNDEGYVDFTLAPQARLVNTTPKLSAIDSGAAAEVYKLTATEASSGISKEIIVNTATILTNGIRVVNTASVPHTHFTNSIGQRNQEFVVDQNVSPRDNLSANSVEFTTNAEMRFGLEEKADREPNWEKDFTEGGTVTGAASGLYSVYNRESDERTTTQITEVPKGIQYLTLDFAKINLSEFTRIDVDLYETVPGRPQTRLSGRTITRENNTTDVSNGLSVQLDLSEVAGNQAQNRNAERRLVVSLITQGRVYVTEENYILKSVKGMWRLEGDSQIDGQPLPEGTVDWVTVPEVGREQSSMSVSEFNNLFTGQGPAAGNDQVSYTVPVFPYTGDAFITLRDKDNNVKSIYAYPAVATQNKNDIVRNRADYPNDPILITNEEATRVVEPQLSQVSNNAIVSTTDTGRTELKATLNINGLSDDEFNVQNGKELYTSVQWTPVSSGSTDEQNDYYSVEGQIVTVRAQLCDVNGNRKTLPGQSITFDFDTDSKLGVGATTNTTLNTNTFFVDGNMRNANVILASTLQATDTNGQVNLDLLGDGLASIRNLRASCPGFTVALSIIRDGQVLAEINNGADIYWADLGLQFKESAALDPGTNANDELVGFETQYSNSVMDITAIDSVVGEQWKIGYWPVARIGRPENGSTTPIMIDHVPVNYTLSSNTITDNAGKPVSISTNNLSDYLLGQDGEAATVTSRRNFDMYLTGKIKAAEVNNANFRLNGSGEPIINVGHGTSLTLSETGLKQTIRWAESGLSVQAVPKAVAVAKGGNTTIDVQVLDDYQNVYDNATVDYDISVPGMDPNIPIAGIHMVDQALVNGKLSIDLTADMTVNPGICFITVTGKVGGAMSQTVQTAVTILE